MKKILSALMAGTMLFGSALAFAGCGGSNASSKADDTSKTESAAATADSATKDSATKDSAVNGELHMATNAAFPPYEYVDGQEIVGIDAEIAGLICDKLGYTLVIDDMEFDSIITAVQSGKADFGMAGMTVTDERLEAIDFTDTYTNAVQVIIVKEGDEKIKTKDDLKSAAIAVQKGTTGDLYVSDYEAEGATIERLSNGADAVLALTQGKVDAVVIDNEPAKAFVAQNQGLVILDEPFENEQYAICVAKGSELTQKINTALAELKNEGKIDEIINKYIKA